MHQDETLHIFTKIFKRIGKDWPKFISDLKRKADKDDESIIYFEKFLYTLYKFGIKLNDKQKDSILTSFPGKEGGDPS